MPKDLTVYLIGLQNLLDYNYNLGLRMRHFQGTVFHMKLNIK